MADALAGEGNGGSSEQPPRAAADKQLGLMLPPPPLFSGQPAPSPTLTASKPSGVKTAVLAAAAAAAANVAPGQRDRAIAEATLAVMSQHADAAAYRAKNQATAAGGEPQTAPSTSAPAAPGQPAPAASSYTPPPWAGAPEGVDYTLETLRNGAVLHVQPVSAKDHYTFGRMPECDFVLEHPSASRLHAVLQFNGTSKEAFLMDCGSTHGAFVNKTRIKAGVHVPLPVGSTFKLGQSSRIYVLNGPQELMPEEGLSKLQRRQLADLEYAKKMAQKEREAAQIQMQAVISGDMSWGMREDAGPMDPEDMSTIDWRAYMASNPLNDKQQKLAEKVRSREYKTANMRKEVDRIQAKEKSEGGLTQGQASTVVRNEQVIEKLAEEIEEIEEQLNESVRQALRGKLREKEGKEAELGGAKRRRMAGLDEEDQRYLEASDSEDEVYDRTRAAGKKGKQGKVGGKGVAVVESAESLYGKKELLQEEQQRLRAAIAAEEKKAAEGKSAEPAAVAAAAPGAAERPEAGPGQPQAGVEGKAGAAPVEAPAEAKTEEDVNPGEDSLDAFMGVMQSSIEVDKLKGLRKELVDSEAQLKRVERLLQIADPDGWLNAGSKSVVEAKAKAAKVLAAEKQRQAALAAAAAKRAEQESISGFVEEFEEDEPAVPAPSSTGVQVPQVPEEEVGGLQIRIHPGTLVKGLPGSGAGAGKGVAAAAAVAAKAGPPKGRPVNAAAEAAAAQLVRDFSTSAMASAQPPVGADASVGSTKGHKRHADELALDLAADARVAADMALLSRAGAEADEEGAGNGKSGSRGGKGSKRKGTDSAAGVEGWVRPTDQTGDGRTALNERFGY